MTSLNTYTFANLHLNNLLVKQVAAGHFEEWNYTGGEIEAFPQPKNAIS
jgi:hypothetical protein